MTTSCKVTELFCIIDEFCKHFDAENAGNLLEDNSGVKRRQKLHISEAVWLSLWGWHTVGDWIACEHEKQVDTVLWQDDVAQEIHHRNHQRYAEEYGTDCTFAPQVCKQLYHEPYFGIGSILLLRQQAKGFAGILHRRHQTAVTILRAKQLLSAFCYYPLLMAWEGGVCTLHLYCIKHSVIPNWGMSILILFFLFIILFVKSD